MISKKTKYALKALGYLAEHSTGEPILIAELAEKENIPKKFLEAILVALRKGGILVSRIGKGGGYLLAVPPAEIMVSQVVRILEGEFAPLPCLSEAHGTRCEECDDQESCGIRLVMWDVKNAVTGVMDAISVADMVERSRAVRMTSRKIIDFSI
ncbi:MAG TPA: Rrf2 family transcriptional regulator [Candidatus Deferrimicrobiaceae bacterium]|jgi:Rrf2 family protein